MKYADDIVSIMNDRGSIKVPEDCITSEEFDKWMHRAQGGRKMTRYEWETIRQEEMKEMRQRQIRLGKRRQRGRNEAFKGLAQMALSVVLIVIAQVTDIADTGLVILAIIFAISGICSTLSGTRKWIN